MQFQDFGDWFILLHTVIYAEFLEIKSGIN